MDRFRWNPTTARTRRVALPPEILDEIFQYVTAGAAAQKYPPNMASAPWTLTRVCSQWRSVAINQRRLWENYHLDGRENSTKALKFFRTRPVPPGGFSVLMHSADALPIPTEDFMHSWEKIISAMGPIKNFEIITCITSLPPLLLSSSTPDLSKLRSLAIGFSPVGMDDEDLVRMMIATIQSPTVFRSMHRLQKLTLSFMQSERAMAAFLCNNDIPWSRLTSFHVSCSDLDLNLLRICLQKCKSLQELGLEFMLAHADKKSHSGILHLPQLSSISYRSGTAHGLFNMGIPWDQLRDVVIQGPTDFSTSSILGLFQRLRSVQRLTLVAGGPQTIDLL
ncbi:hypothetical protein DXG01_009984 [Tephrocybe rancida]|nr:hypothetical protein DXG01_009984 [Tephrocybe rancida]